MQNPAYDLFPFGRAMLVDRSNCSLSMHNGHICIQEVSPAAAAQYTCNICKAAHFCSAYCRMLDEHHGWHHLLDLKIQALGAALPVYLPYFLARQLRDRASSRALDILLADPNDINRPMIPALYYQLRMEEEALDFMARACPMPRLTQTEPSRVLTEEEGSLSTPSLSVAMYIAETGEAGLAYAAITALIKMNRFTDMNRARLLNNGGMRAPFCSVRSSYNPGYVDVQAHREAEKEFMSFVTAVLIRQEDFWEKLLREIGAMQDARKAVRHRIPGAIEVERRASVAPTAPPINALFWVLPAWWAASAPGSAGAAHTLVNVLLTQYGFSRQRLPERRCLY
ncbi:hypothetical protein VPNG_09070 [Cytospora leucostoma]|uniref:Uncharacterized protein n=1 Tax=Cytospora leucostoma TaxID=1230097 RepID=A0A423VZC0_9PEZI|nr:hypothetical protein VPNG_09070 [Cytospora leucostoma]